MPGEIPNFYDMAVGHQRAIARAQEEAYNTVYAIIESLGGQVRVPRKHLVGDLSRGEVTSFQDPQTGDMIFKIQKDGGKYGLIFGQIMRDNPGVDAKLVNSIMRKVVDAYDIKSD